MLKFIARITFIYFFKYILEFLKIADFSTTYRRPKIYRNTVVLENLAPEHDGINIV